MRTFKKTQVFLALMGISFLSLVFLGFNCGGGGDGGGEAGITYTGLRTWAVIDENNAVDLATGACMGYGAWSVIEPFGVQSGEHRRIGRPFTLLVAQRVTEALHRVYSTSPLVGIGPSATQCDSETVYGDCGGSAYTYLCVDDVSGFFNGYLTYSSYCSDGITISGRADFSGNIDFFTLDLQMNCAATNMLFLDNTTGKVYWAKDYNMIVTKELNYVDVDIVWYGRYYDPDYGYVDYVNTPDPFRIYDGDDYPSFGILFIGGDKGIAGGSTMAWLQVLSSTTYHVQADTTGDGTRDFDSGVLSW